ncbi:MFS transporter [Halieaceae bacterium IMCC14734]|uniref:MFS transporter n=1 Tax=Candidatus Litorirhabdus singularis TaxID=2518993 RepID=A0ABT3TH65_9GAMM|nr:MFS transporter [Candidatus Litorirhabdus singularis]MCX2981633.1 MFS transporter [Candidatus Litorirhabdus singularis]
MTQPTSSSTSTSALTSLLGKAVKIEPHEVRATLTSFAFVFVLMAAYYILRPVRDAMASDWTDAEVSWLWTFTFFFSAIAVSLYGGAVSRIRFQRLVPSVYGFFTASFLLFYAATQMTSDRELIDKAFYVWISVFSLFHVSVFWSFMADLFSKAQAPRLFGFIGAGASTGALAGPAIPTFFAGSIGTDNLTLIASGLLVLTIPLIGLLQNLKQTDLHNESVHVGTDDLEFIGGNPLSGFTDFIKNPYLLGIGLFILLYTSIGSFVYFELKNLLADYSREERSQIWASMDLVVNSLTLLIAFFVTGRMATRMGLPFTLASVPVLIMGGLVLVATMPVVSVVVALQIVRRAGNYAVTRPAREMLFTAVDRETRFKAKPVIDIVVYRGGDMLNAWAFTGLTTGLGLGLGAVALVGAGIAGLWAAVGIYLGRSWRDDIRDEKAA